MELARGTQIRLDALSAGRFYEGGEHYSVDARFCVLDGPFAGTCWRAYQVEFTDGSVRTDAPSLVAVAERNGPPPG